MATASMITSATDDSLKGLQPRYNMLCVRGSLYTEVAPFRSFFAG
ncbi:MAG TPA: hypothetical protein VGP76_20555 [Planctomycetaceae bacterium]|nr:hypothetical protein [Planctomycetaceae bacterium]